MKTQTQSIRAKYVEKGVEGYYTAEGHLYRNPHEKGVQRAIMDFIAENDVDLSNVLDLACGAGEATLALLAMGAEEVTGVDPYTRAAYKSATGQDALPYTFDDVAKGILRKERYSFAVCSFALHLAKPAVLPVLCQELACVAPEMLVLSPHKRPAIRRDWGWELQRETVNAERVRSWHYVSLLHGSNNPG